MGSQETKPSQMPLHQGQFYQEELILAMTLKLRELWQTEHLQSLRDSHGEGPGSDP